jgi:2-haloacid dehalogenase
MGASPATGQAQGERIDFSKVSVLTFDCYGTLIDWETGIVAALAPVLAARGVALAGDELLEAFAREEGEAEAGPYLPYREVLARSMRGVCAAYEVEPLPSEVEAFAGSIANWPAFPDSRAALARLAMRFKLAVITNCDDDLFAASSAKLGDPFTWVVTAQRAGSYKPALHNFELAFEIMGVPRTQIVHVAQSLFHDHVPAAALGLRSVWIDRRHGRAGSGATPRTSASPDLTAPDMATFADLALRHG